MLIFQGVVIKDVLVLAPWKPVIGDPKWSKKMDGELY